jgi:hypothetical protein
MTALFILDVAGHRGLVSYIDAGIVTYEITDVNFSFGVLERAVLFEDIQLGFYQIGVLNRAILKPF